MNEKVEIEELLIDLAKVEELTTQQLITIVKSILTAVATGQDIKTLNSIYQQYYQELEKRLAQEGRNNPNNFSDLWEFYQYWSKSDLTTYASRRVFISKLYSSPEQSKNFDIWSLLHPDIVEIAKSRFQSKHYADAVEASFKEINTRVKSIVRQTTEEELDGSELMNYAFSPKNPVLIFDDLSTMDGKSIQVGYMQIFSGAMTGIRNPKAHGNIILKPEEAIPMIFLASFLLNKLESAQSNPDISLQKNAKGLIIELSQTADAETLQSIKYTLETSLGKCDVFLDLPPHRKRVKTQTKVNVSTKLIANIKKIKGVIEAKVV